MTSEQPPFMWWMDLTPPRDPPERPTDISSTLVEIGKRFSAVTEEIMLAYANAAERVYAILTDFVPKSIATPLIKPPKKYPLEDTSKLYPTSQVRLDKLDLPRHYSDMPIIRNYGQNAAIRARLDRP